MKSPDRPIVIIGPAHPLRGGLAAFNERLAKAFQQQGHRVMIYTFSLQYPSILFPGKTQYSSEPAPKSLDIRIAINSVNPVNWWRVGRAIRKLNPKLVICKFWLPFMAPCFGTILRQIKSDTDAKVVSIIDNIIPHEKRPGDRQLAQYFVNAVDAFIVMSRSVGEDMKRFVGRQPVSYIPHPIYDNYGALLPKTEARNWLGLPAEGAYLLFFGFIRAYKGLDLLLRAMADDRIRSKGIRLIVAGEFYDEEVRYQQLIDELGIGNTLILKTDFIPDSEVRYYFCAADLVVQPYKSATQSGISQLAYHFEKPMLVTEVGGLPEIVDHGRSGYVVPVEPVAITEAIIDYYDQQKEGDFQASVRRAKLRYSWENLTKEILEIR